MADDAYARALRLLGQRAHLRAELRRKLQQRGYDADEIETALDRCAARGYLDDEATAAALAREGQARRGWGSAKVKAELVKRGAGAAAIGAALAQTSPDEEVARAREVAAQWRRKTSSGGDPRAALARHLDRKGFSRRAIVAALQDAGAAGDLDDLETPAEPAD